MIIDTGGSLYSENCRSKVKCVLRDSTSYIRIYNYVSFLFIFKMWYSLFRIKWQHILSYRILQTFLLFFATPFHHSSKKACFINAIVSEYISIRFTILSPSSHTIKKWSDIIQLHKADQTADYYYYYLFLWIHFGSGLKLFRCSLCSCLYSIIPEY